MSPLGAEIGAPYGKIAGRVFFFSVLETQLRTLYVLGKHLSKELQPSPVFFFSF